MSKATFLAAAMQTVPSLAAAAAEEGMALLEAWAVLIETGISNIEAGHSSIREFTKQRARGAIQDSGCRGFGFRVSGGSLNP